MAENIRFLNLDRFSKNLKPVNSSSYLTRTNEFHPQGLFSELIFGPVGSADRKKLYSFINLYCKVIHPTALKIIMQLDRRVEKLISTQMTYSVDKAGKLIEDENGVAGLSAFIKMFPKIKWRGETKTREAYINLLKKSYKEGTLFINKVPVIPPDQRPILHDEERNEWIPDHLNDFYLTIIRRADSIRSFGKSGTLFDILNFNVQLAINDHNEFIQTKIGKKSGIIRNQLLGKRVEFSARAVITSGPTLNTDEIGIPLMMAVSLFKPFLVHILLNTNFVDKEELSKEIKSFTDNELSVESVERVIRSIKNGDVVPEKLYNIIFNATEAACRGRLVLAKRDPMLHPEGIRALKPVLVNGKTIQMCTLQVGGYNADFDGDTMAVFHPLTDEAQEDAKKMQRSGTGNSKTISFEISKEMCVGLYEITKNIETQKTRVTVTQEDLKNATDPYIPVIYNGVKTTMGKAIFNDCLPKGYGFIEKQVDKKVANNILKDITNRYGGDVAKESANRMKTAGFKFATIIAPSISIENTKMPAEINTLRAKLKGQSVERQIEILDRMNQIGKDKLKNTTLGDLVESGSTKGWDQPMQMFVAKGIVADPKGNVLPAISGSFSEGLSATEYFSAASGARKGMADRTLNTADTGYTSRQLVFLLNSVEADLYLKDCGTKRYLTLKLTDDIIGRLNGRFIVKGSGVQEFIPSHFKSGDVVDLRSPIYCTSPKICHTCYGRLLERHKTPYVGILAGQIIGERGTQLIMRTFHTGGAIKLERRNILQDIVENDPLTTIESIKNYIHQDENNLHCSKSCKIIINMSDYDNNDTIEVNEDETGIWVKSLLCRIEFEDLMFNIILDYPVSLHIPDVESITYEGKERIIIEYNEHDVILDVPLEKRELKEQVLYVKRLVGGREVFKDTSHLLMKLYKVYGPIAGDMDFVHLEILVSQSMRDKENPSMPARLGKNPDDPEMVNIKKNIFNTGFLQGLAFENVGEAIRTGLITQKNGDNSIIEKVLTGTIVEKKKEDEY